MPNQEHTSMMPNVQSVAGQQIVAHLGVLQGNNFQTVNPRQQYVSQPLVQQGYFGGGLVFQAMVNPHVKQRGMPMNNIIGLQPGVQSNSALVIGGMQPIGPNRYMHILEWHHRCIHAWQIL